MEAPSIIRNYRTVGVALVVALIVVALVFTGRLDPTRAALTIGICWVVATHSADSYAHKAEIVSALNAAARAGIKWRTGQQRKAIATAEAGAVEVCEDIQEEKRSKAHDPSNTGYSS